MAKVRNRVTNREYKRRQFMEIAQRHQERKLVNAAEITNLKIPINESTGQRLGDVRFAHISANGRWTALSLSPGFIYILDSNKQRSIHQIATNNELFKPVFHPSQENTLMGISNSKIHIRIWKFKNKTLLEYIWRYPAFIMYDYKQFLSAVFQPPESRILIAYGTELLCWDMGETDRTVPIANTGSIHNKLVSVIPLPGQRACMTVVTMGLDLALVDSTGFQTTLGERNLGKLQYWPSYDTSSPRIENKQQNIIQVRIKWDGEQSIAVSRDHQKMVYFRQPNRDKSRVQICMISLISGRIGTILWERDLSAESTSCSLSPSGVQLVVGRRLYPHQETLMEIYDTSKSTDPIARIDGNIWAKFMRITGIQYFPISGLGFIYTSSDGNIKLVRPMG